MTDFTKDIGSLSPDKRALLDLLLKKKGAEFNTFPLSFAQQRLWFLDQLEPNNAFYNIPAALRLNGALDVQVLERTLTAIVERHETLRTIFAVINGKPVQVILPAQPLTLPVVDLGALPRTEREHEARRRATAEAQRPFNLAQGPLLRVTLLRLAEKEHVVLFTMHHIISDGWSRGVLIKEVKALYEAYSSNQPSPLPELPIQYADFAVWQREWLQGDALNSQLVYWKQQLAAAPATLDLPTDHPRPAVQTFRGAQQSLSLSREVSEGLKRLSQEEGATLFMTLLAAFQVLLSRDTGQEEMLIGTPIAGRTRAEVEELIGFFVNTLVLRGRVRGEESFREALRGAREVCIGAYAHQEVPFEKLVEELQPSRDLSRHPLFQVMFVLQNAGQETLELPKLTMSRLETDTGASIFDLTLSMLEVGGKVAGSLEYNTDLFEPESIERMLRHLQRLLEGVVADPDQRVSELPLLGEAELHQLLYEWNDTRAPFPTERCIHQLFEAQAERTPEAIAVVSEAEQMSYAELNRRANQLAHHLRSLGVGPESLVGILLERSLEMVISLLGVLKAGAAYVPLDPQYPQQRLQWMVDDAHLAVLLTTERLRQTLVADTLEVVCVDTEWEQIGSYSVEPPAVDLSAHNLAYVIYTSGSTGRPKGVCISHHSLVNYTSAVAPHFHLQPTDRVLQFAPLGFDVLVEELFPCLTSGGCLVLRPDHPLSVAEFRELLERQRITWLEVPAAFWHQWVAELVETRERLPDSLRLVIVGSEKPQIERVREWQERTGKDLIYIFGLTETTVTNTLYHVRAERELGAGVSVLPIGSPVANTQVYVLDKEMQPVGVGISGELYIGGEGLARGYLNRAEWTAERFIPDGWSGKRGERLYRTGDVVRWVGGGKLEFVGRMDEQVKVRGYRIELGEVEAMLREEEAVAEAVVVARDEGQRDEKRLVAYVVAEEGAEISVRQMQKRLRERLPEYMMPSAFVMLDELPLTPNGKVDRRALPAPDTLRPELEGGYVAARTPVEETLAGIWAEVLKVGRVGVDDNFFELGGHSLLAMQVVSRVCDTFQVTLPLIAIFESPTVASLARAIVQSQAQQLDDEAAAQVLSELEALSDDQVQLLLDGQELDQDA